MLSLGPDRKRDTADDVESWSERGARDGDWAPLSVATGARLADNPAAGRQVHCVMRTYAMVVTAWLVAAAVSGCVVTGRSGRRVGVGPTLLAPSMVDRQGFSDPMAPIVPTTENPLHPEAAPGRPRHDDARVEVAERTLLVLVARYLFKMRPAIAIFGTF